MPGATADRTPAAEKGGDAMQEQVRYYITKSGEEPTVRSVKVAVSPADLQRPYELEAPAGESPAVLDRDQDSKTGVQRLVSGAIRKRPRRN